MVYRSNFVSQQVTTGDPQPSEFNVTTPRRYYMIRNHPNFRCILVVADTGRLVETRDETGFGSIGGQRDVPSEGRTHPHPHHPGARGFGGRGSGLSQGEGTRERPELTGGFRADGDAQHQLASLRHRGLLVRVLAGRLPVSCQSKQCLIVRWAKPHPERSVLDSILRCHVHDLRWSWFYRADVRAVVGSSIFLVVVWVYSRSDDSLPISMSVIHF